MVVWTGPPVPAKFSASLPAEEGRVIDYATTNVRQVGKPTNQVALASQQADKPGPMVGRVQCHHPPPVTAPTGLGAKAVGKICCDL